MPVTASKYGIARDHMYFPDGILSNIIQASSMLPHFCKHVNHVIPQKEIRLGTTYSDLLMNTPALFKYKPIHSHPHKSKNSLVAHLPVAFDK